MRLDKFPCGGDKYCKWDERNYVIELHVTVAGKVPAACQVEFDVIQLGAVFIIVCELV